MDCRYCERITIDGLRVRMDEGWGLVRPSNTLACLVIRFEANTEEDLQAIQAVFRQEMLRIDLALSLPF